MILIGKKEGGYMRKKRESKIPLFKTDHEEAVFWDSHSFMEFDSELEDVDITVKLHRPKQDTLVLRVQKDIKDKLVKVARIKGINVSTLARIWLTEKLHSINAV